MIRATLLLLAVSVPIEAGVGDFQRVAMGEWKIDAAVVRQMDAHGPARLLYGSSSQQRYSMTARLTMEGPAIGSEAGFLIHFLDADNYIAYSVVRRKSGAFAVLRIARKKPQLSFVADQIPIDGNGPWELRADVNGRDVYCYIDGKPSVAYSFEGTPPPYNSHGKTWEPDPISGWSGLMATNAVASFGKFQTTPLKSTGHMVIPQKGRFDGAGALLPRQTYSETMRFYSEWFLSIKEVVDKSKAPAAIQSWAPYLLTNFVSADDSLWDVGGEFAFNHAILMEGAVYYYTYTGNSRYLDIAITTADWQIQNRTPRDWARPYLAPSFVSFEKDGSWKGQEWGYEPDKSAYLGYALLKLYAATGRQKYLDAALEISGTLATMQGPNGDWPFRVNARTGEVKHGYTCSQLWYVWFFEKLADVTRDPSYRKRSERAFQWLLENPVRTNQWLGLYGDIASGARSFDQWVALETAMYLIDRRSDDPSFVEKAKAIVEWIDRALMVDHGFFPGVPGIVEQTDYRIVLTHHQLRWAEINAKLWTATGVPEYRRRAIEAANSVTWNLMSDGKMRQGFWDHAKAVPLTLSFNNQFGRIMAAIPTTAPKSENHLLEATALVAPISYQADRIEYRTFGPSRDVLILSSAPKRILSGDKEIPGEYEPQTGRLLLVHESSFVRIEFGNGSRARQVR